MQSCEGLSLGIALLDSTLPGAVVQLKLKVAEAILEAIG